MFCPYCGRNIPNHTTICPYCRGFVSEAMIASYYQYTQENTASEAPDYTYGAAAGYVPEQPKRRKWPIVIVLLLVLAIAAVIAVPLFQEATASSRTDHRVTFLLKTPGYNDEATALPVQVTGTKADGTAYDTTVYLDGGGNGVALEPGEYTLTFLGGSILSNGTVLVAPNKATLEVTVPTDLARNEFVQVPTSKAITYKAVAPLDLKDKTLDKVYAYALQAPNDNGKADKLRANAIKARETAIAKHEEAQKAIEKKASGKLKVSLGDEAQFVGTMEINTADEVAKRLGDENIGWNFEGQTLAVLWLDKPRKVTVETSTTDEYDGYNLYFDQDDGSTYTETQEFSVSCLLLHSDVEGVYAAGDDGSLAAHDGQRVLATGKVGYPSDWSSSLVSPIVLINPDLEYL